MDVKNDSVRAFFKRQQYNEKKYEQLQRSAVYLTKQRLRKIYGNNVKMSVITIHGIKYVVLDRLNEYYFGWRDRNLVMKHKVQGFNEYTKVNSIADIGEVIAFWEGL